MLHKLHKIGVQTVNCFTEINGKPTHSIYENTHEKISLLLPTQRPPTLKPRQWGTSDMSAEPAEI